MSNFKRRNFLKKAAIGTTGAALAVLKSTTDSVAGHFMPLASASPPFPSPSPSTTPSVTPSLSLTPTPTNTPTATNTPSITRTMTITRSVSQTRSISFSPSLTPSISPTPTITQTPSQTPEPSFTPTPSVTPSSVTENPLPVSIVSFTVKEDLNGAVMLGWVTASEKNNKGFEIQRSTDGYFFQEIGWENGHGNSSQMQHYFFRDAAPVAGEVNYYRLKQRDFDGKHEYSVIRAYRPAQEITTPVVGQFKPNPAETSTSISIEATAATSALFTIMNVRGDVALKKEHKLAKGNNFIDLDVRTLSSGIYFVHFIINEDTHTRKLAVSR